MPRALLLTGLIAVGLALGPVALPAADAPAEIALTIENHRFQPEEIRVKAGKAFTLVVTNKDSSAEELESHALRIEKVIPGGQTVKVRVPALKPGRYDFVGEYHEKTAKGRIVAE